MTTACFWKGSASRHVLERFVVEVDLTLLTPAHLGNGEAEGDTDMPLLTDACDPERPLLQGSSIAGAIRAAVRQWEQGYFAASHPGDLSNLLFGDLVNRGKNRTCDNEGEQSPLIVNDALGKPGTYGVEVRDGVRIARRSRTASERGLYNAEFWKAGTVFPLRFELVLCDPQPGEEARTPELQRALALGLTCLQEAARSGRITLGMRKRRGFGAVRADNWRFKRFDLTSAKGLLEWLWDKPTQGVGFEELQETLLSGAKLPPRKGRTFRVTGEFAIDGSLLIRSGSVLDDLDVDMVHLHSCRPGEAGPEEVPVLSGTSLCGALRTRAWAIAECLGGSAFADQIGGNLFGPEMGLDAGRKSGRASRIEISEAEIDGTPTPDEQLVQSRVSIDRFTGGALETALFNEQPVFGNGNGVVAKLQFTLREPDDATIGLFLHTLKDLAVGDLPVGGEAAVGRGLLQATGALHMSDYRDDKRTFQAMIAPGGQTPPGTTRQGVNGFATALRNQACQETDQRNP